MKTSVKQASESIKVDAGELFEAVCLRDSGFGLAGEVIELSEQDVKTGQEQGALDTHKDAIVYAKAK